jgi:AAA ATPase domain
MIGRLVNRATLLLAPRGEGWRISEVRSTAFAVKEAAPPRAALVTAATLQATQRAITYAPAQLLPLAGAKEPVAVWEALAPRPRTGRAPAPLLGVGLVGREGELAILTDRYQRVRVGGGPQLVTLVGAAGIGKSRLVAELGHRVAAEAEPPSWRAGRGATLRGRWDLRGACRTGQGGGGHP